MLVEILVFCKIGLFLFIGFLVCLSAFFACKYNCEVIISELRDPYGEVESKEISSEDSSYNIPEIIVTP
ncbi:unnamed protein product [Caenorhabditis brenneri]